MNADQNTPEATKSQAVPAQANTNSVIQNNDDDDWLNTDAVYSPANPAGDECEACQ